MEKSNSAAESGNQFQLGTGSTDFTVNGMYDIRLQDAGISVSASYKMNTANMHEYSYGNKFSINTQLYHKFNVKGKCTIAPNAGFLFENAAKDIDRGFVSDISGGKLLMATAGIETNFKHYSVGANYQLPVSQQLAAGIIKANNRAMVHISFLL